MKQVQAGFFPILDSFRAAFLAPTTLAALLSVLLFPLLSASAQEGHSGSTSSSSIQPLRPVQGSGSDGKAAVAAAQEQLDAAEVRELISELSDPSYRVRERAGRRILRLDEGARPFLREALESKDAELRARAERLLEDLDRRKARGPGEGAREGMRPRSRLHSWEQVPWGTPFERLRLPFRGLEHDLWRGEWRPLLEEMRELTSLFDEGLPGRLEEHLERMQDQLGRLEVELHSRLRGLGPGEPGGRGERSSRLQVWRDGERILDSGSHQSFGDVPSLGIVVESLHPALRVHLSLGDEGGMMVSRVEEGSPAERAGLERYDIILSIGERMVHDLSSVRQALREALEEATGDDTEMNLIRRGERRTIRLDLTD
ncbi:MAG: PDZ domain-containing protein [Planctomycetota bacterium]